MSWEYARLKYERRHVRAVGLIFLAAGLFAGWLLTKAYQ
jgi:hypothetical protein